MNKRTVLASLNKIANELDNSGLHNEANTITKVMVKLAYDEDEFENDRVDKYVYLDRRFKMNCQFNYKFKKWVPISMAE